MKTAFKHNRHNSGLNEVEVSVNFDFAEKSNMQNYGAAQDLLSSYEEYLQKNCENLPNVTGADWTYSRLEFFVKSVNDFFAGKNTSIITFTQVCETAELYF